MEQDQTSIAPRAHGRTLFYIIAILVAAAVGFGIWFASAPLYPVTSEQRTLWDAGAGSDAWKVYVVEDGERKDLSYRGGGFFSGISAPGQTFFAQRTLEDDYEQAVLLIDSEYCFSVFLDGKLLYTQEPGSSAVKMDELEMSGELSGAADPAAVALPKGYAGKTLTIVSAQRGGEREGSVYLGPVILIGSARLLTGLSSELLGTTYPAVLLLVLAFVLAGAFLYSTYRGKPNASTLYLFLCSLLWTGSVLTASPLLREYYDWAGPLAQLFYYDGFVFMFLSLAEQMRKYRRLVYILAAVYAIVFVFGLLSEYMFTQNFLTEIVQQIPEYLTFPLLILAITLTFIEARKSKGPYRLFRRLFIIGCLLFGAALCISAFRGGMLYDWFCEHMLADIEDFRFEYMIDVLRFILIGDCFVCTAAQFFRVAVKHGADRALIRERIKLAQQTYRELERHAKREAAMRDDVRRHLSVADDYLAEDAVDLAQLYLHQISVALERATVPVSTCNPVVDAILNAKIYEARGNGIDINVQTGRLPRLLPLTEEELAAVLLNTLDNAIAAAAQSRKKTMTVNVSMHKGFFCYRCENSTGLMPEPASGHGYGLQIVEEIADERDASFVLEQGQHMFVVSLAFPTPSAHRGRKESWVPG